MNDSGGGLWQPPAGQIEAGETWKPGDRLRAFGNSLGLAEEPQGLGRAVRLDGWGPRERPGGRTGWQSGDETKSGKMGT